MVPLWHMVQKMDTEKEGHKQCARRGDEISAPHRKSDKKG